MNLTIDCEKHGQNQRALPVINGAILPWTEWPKDVERHPRMCCQCVAAAMVNPVRKCG